MTWTETYQDPDELRGSWAGRPHARYRPLTAWWWSGEQVTEDRMLWQLDRIAEIGCGGFDITGLAMHGPSAGSVSDEPRALTPEWFRLYRLACERARELGLGVGAWSPMQVGQAHDIGKLLREHPQWRGELVLPGGRVVPYGADYGSPEAIAALTGPGTMARAYLDGIEDLLGDPVVAVFEDEFPAFPRWSPAFAAEFRARYGADVPLDALFGDVGPRTPAIRCQVVDLAVERVTGAYTAWQDDLVRKHDLLAGYDQNNRQATPLISSAYYYDPFRTMTWANAHGTDQMGCARFHQSLTDLYGGARVWLEGFHSHGWGMTLEDQMRLLYDWAREGISLYLPHGMYYAQQALWWEWAPPENGWRQPYARHYAAFSDTVGRLMAWNSAGVHVPEVAALYPMSTVWAGMRGHLAWDDFAFDSERAWTEVFGTKGVPSGWDLERPKVRSVLAAAGYDRVAVDEPHVDHWDLPLVVPGCRVLRTATLEALVARAEAGKTVVVVAPYPEWSFENGRDDAGFAALVERLRAAAPFVPTAEAALAHLPPPRAEGLETQWRRVGDLDLVFAGGTGRVRLRGMRDRAPERWDPAAGTVAPYPATVDGDDLLLDVEGPATLLSLPRGVPMPPADRSYDDISLPEVWDVEYLPWGENRWGDYRLPANDGTPPVERRTFAFREGDGGGWERAPVVPEDVQHPLTELGFEERMKGATGRVHPRDRALPDGWHEVVSTYGPKAVVDGTRLAEYSERLGVEDAVLTTPIGLKGKVEQWKVDLGEAAGEVVSWGRVETDVDTHLVVEGSGVLTVFLDGARLAGPVDAGVLAVPVSLRAGWHEVRIVAERREIGPSILDGWRPGPRTRLTWCLTEPYRREPVAIWGGAVVHPDYKGAPGPMTFRRSVRVPERARVRWHATSAAEVACDLPEVLEPGEHVVTVTVGSSLTDHRVGVAIELTMPSGTVWLTSNDQWEYEREDGTWTGAFPIGEAGSISWLADDGTGEAFPRRHALTDVAWLEGGGVLAGQVPQLWADAPDPPPPAWFCFTAPPGAVSITVPVVGDVTAWVDGEPVAVTGGVLPLREHVRVALRVQAPAGYRGAACFTEHPVLALGPGTLRSGASWHRQGLDCFSGVIRHRATVVVDRGGDAVLDLGEVRGSVEVRVNGEAAGVLFCRPWRLPVTVRTGANEVELVVANTLGPMAGRGIPTPFGPEDQRFSGLLGTPVLRVAR